MACLPSGIGGRIGLKEQSTRRARPIDVIELATSGNREQRRWAKNKISGAVHQPAKGSGHGKG